MTSFPATYNTHRYTLFFNGTELKAVKDGDKDGTILTEDIWRKIEFKGKAPQTLTAFITTLQAKAQAKAPNLATSQVKSQHVLIGTPPSGQKTSGNAFLSQSGPPPSGPTPSKVALPESLLRDSQNGVWAPQSVDRSSMPKRPLTQNGVLAPQSVDRSSVTRRPPTQTVDSSSLLSSMPKRPPTQTVDLTLELVLKYLETLAFLKDAGSNIDSLERTLSEKRKKLFTEADWDLRDHTWLQWFSKLELGQGQGHYQISLTNDAVKFSFEAGDQHFKKAWVVDWIVSKQKSADRFISNFQQFCDNPKHPKTQKFIALLIAKIKEIASHDLTTCTDIEELKAEKGRIEIAIEALKSKTDTFENTFLQTDKDRAWLDVFRQVMNTTRSFESDDESDAESDDEDYGF